MANKITNFLQYLGNNRDILAGARLNSPAVADVKQTVKTNPEAAANKAKNYAIEEAAVQAVALPHLYTFGPMYNVAITEAEQAAQGGMAGTLLMGDIAGSVIAGREALRKYLNANNGKQDSLNNYLNYFK